MPWAQGTDTPRSHSAHGKSLIVTCALNSLCSMRMVLFIFPPETERSCLGLTGIHAVVTAHLPQRLAGKGSEGQADKLKGQPPDKCLDCCFLPRVQSLVPQTKIWL